MRLNTFITLLSLVLLNSGCTKPPEVSETNSKPLAPWNVPLQKKVQGNTLFSIKTSDAEFIIKPLYEYEVSARVVGKKKYSSFNWQGKVAPFDLALAWEELSKPHYVKFVSFTQKNRWYYFSLKKNAPFDVDFVYKRSSNNHIIPKNENIHNVLKKINKNDIIKLTGYLVRLDGNWKGSPVWWVSSTSRKDKGDGSCEVIYVTGIQKEDKIYQ